MLQFRRRRRNKKKPRVVPRRPSKEELMANYEKWLLKHPGMDFSESEMKMYLQEYWDIDRIINYRLHGIYDKWYSTVDDEMRFSEAEFDDFFDRGVSIQEILARRPHIYRKTVVEKPSIYQNVECLYNIDAPPEDFSSDDFEYRPTDEMDYDSDEIENEM